MNRWAVHQCLTVARVSRTLLIGLPQESRARNETTRLRGGLLDRG